MRKTLPHFIGIGGVHTGWQTLLPLLATHPAIDAHIPNTNYFTRTANTPATLTTYTEQFLGDNGLLRGECSPSYLAHLNAPSKIAQSCPDTKLIAVLSHPLQRLVQEWRHLEAGKHKPMRCYEFALSNKSALVRGRYGEALNRYFSYYSPLQLHVVVYEDFIADPLGVLRGMYEFLGVNKDFIPLPLQAYAPVEEEPKRKPFIVKRLITYLPKRYKAYRDAKAQLKITTLPPLQRVFTAEEITELMRYYQDDIAVASALIERDLTGVWE